MKTLFHNSHLHYISVCNLHTEDGKSAPEMQAKNMLVLSLTFNSEKWTTKKLLESITKNKQAGKNVK